MTSAAVLRDARVPAGHEIESLRVRWTVDCMPEPARLDRLISMLTAGVLEAALDDIGVGLHELVCVRRVDVPPFRARWEDSDAAIVQGWSRSIAVALQRSLTSTGDDGNLVRYASPAHAVRDLVDRAVAGDVTRAWAWAQLGLWPEAGSSTGQEAVAEAVERQLLARPELAVGALASISRAGLLDRAVALLGPSRLLRVLAETWARTGAGDGPIGGAASPPGTEAAASALIARSSIARAVLDLPGLDAGPEVHRAVPGRDASPDTMPELIQALATAVVLEVEPARAERPEAPAMVAAVARQLRRHWHLRRAVAETARAGPVVAVPPVAMAPEPAPAPARPAREEPGAGAWHEEPANVPVPERQPAATEWGGLLFLLHLVDWDRLASAAAPGLRMVMHTLGGDLIGRTLPEPAPDPGDPALLAFAGLGPDEYVPVPGSAEEEQAAVLVARSTAGSIVALLRQSLGNTPLAREEEPALLEAVCRRTARIDAVPGWIDAVLCIDSVSTDVRRAGLDLDLGYLRQLGCVVRFLYE